MSAVASARPLLGLGRVWHRRLRPTEHAFCYRSYFVLLPMRAWREQPGGALPRNRFGLIAFADRDHGDGGDDALAWFEGLLRHEGITDADGEIWLQTFPRVLGYAFKPVSFWFAHRADGSLAAVVAEVNNTFGERHCYVLRGPQLKWGARLHADKSFYVSPFIEVAGRYAFSFLRTDEPAEPSSGSGRERRARGRLGYCVARIDLDDSGGTLLQTSISGELYRYTAMSALRAFVGVPLMTIGVIVRIHWQALRLWRKRVPLVPRPSDPERLHTG